MRKARAEFNDIHRLPLQARLPDLPLRKWFPHIMPMDFALGRMD
jgi:hypothetical protein